MGISKRLGNVAGYGDRGSYGVDGRRLSSSAKKGYFYVDMHELNASIEDVIKRMKKAYGIYFDEAVVRSVFEKNAEPIREEMARLAPIKQGGYPARKRKRKRGRPKKRKQAGTLKRAITVFPARSGAVVYIGPRRKKAKYGDRTADGYYGYFQAYGTDAPKGPKKGNLQSPDFIMAAYRAKQAIIMKSILVDMQRKTDLANRFINRKS